ncbi:MAG: cytochrome c biogenesis protein ResB [Dissulfurispiraceae bacterium]|nr:cytochrome c biogenesis protein ResB [Dissulfurispiraceae bacterium]
MNRIWKFFSSVRLAVILFCIISLVSVIGTIVIQNATDEQGIRSLQKIFSNDLAKDIYPVVARLGLTDMYSSWWFVSLLFLFCVNIVVCTIDKLPGAFKAVKSRITPLSDEALSRLETMELSIKADEQHAEDLVIKSLRKSGFRDIFVFRDENKFICAEKWRYSRLGVYVTHLSIVLIFVGAMLNGLYGYNGYINILEGETTDTILLKNGAEKKLPFSIRCDDFDVIFYDNSFVAKEYKSLLTIRKNDSDIKKAEVVVNNPFVYEDVKIYQTNFGFYPQKNALFILNVSGAAGSEMKRLKFNDSFNIPGTSFTAKIVDFNPSIAIDQSSGAVSIRENSMSNPAVQLEMRDNGKLKGYVWILKRKPETGISEDGFRINFLDLWGVQYTGLQVNSMPGMGIIYFGFTALCAGLYACFFMSHQRIWVRIKSSGQDTRLLVAGASNKGQVILKKKIERIADLLQK